MKNQILSEEFKRMQKLAGIINEINSNHKIELKIDDKVVTDTTSNGNPSPEELSKTFEYLRNKLKSKYDFTNAELIVLDPNNKQVASYMPNNKFLKQKAKLMGWGGELGHGTV
jgi:hypothetical protein